MHLDCGCVVSRYGGVGDLGSLNGCFGWVVSYEMIRNGPGFEKDVLEGEERPHVSRGTWAIVGGKAWWGSGWCCINVGKCSGIVIERWR